MASIFEKVMRISRIKQFLLESEAKDRSVKEEQLISMFGMRGIARRKMQEYLKDMENSGIIERKYGFVYIKKEIYDKDTEDKIDEILRAKPVSEEEEVKEKDDNPNLNN